MLHSPQKKYKQLALSCLYADTERTTVEIHLILLQSKGSHQPEQNGLDIMKVLSNYME